MEPTLLMLDEPTNHLDLNAVIWLNKLVRCPCVIGSRVSLAPVCSARVSLAPWAQPVVCH